MDEIVIDSTIVNALINALAIVITGTLALRFRPSNLILTKREIKYRQLMELFAPIERLFVLDDSSDAGKLFEEICAVVDQNLTIVPLDFMALIIRIKEKQEITYADISCLKEITDQYYNSFRKHFGFPYIKRKVDFWKYISLTADWIFAELVPFILCIFAVTMSTASMFASTLWTTGSVAPSLNKGRGMIMVTLILFVISMIAFLFFMRRKQLSILTKLRRNSDKKG